MSNEIFGLLSFISGVFGAIIGAIATYFVMLKVQRRSWSREDIKEIYAPLRTEFESNKRKCKNLDLLRNETWNKINKNDLAWLIPEELRESVRKFYEDDLTRFNADIKNALKKITSVIEKFLESKKKMEEKGKTKDEIYELEKVYNFNKGHLLDQGWGILSQILREKLESRSFLNRKFENIKNALDLDFKSLKDFFDHFSDKFKKTKEYKSLHKTKEDIFKVIDELLTQIKQKIGVE